MQPKQVHLGDAASPKSGSRAPAFRSKSKAEKKCRLCGKCGVLRGAVLLGLVDIANSTLVFIWFSLDSRETMPGIYGYEWWSQMRCMLLPEACVSLGVGLFSMFGALRRRMSAVCVVLGLLAFLIICTIALSLVLLIGAPFYGFWTLMPILYLGWRIYCFLVMCALYKNLGILQGIDFEQDAPATSV